MAAATQSSTPSFFNYLKEGFLLPNHNRSLFVPVFALVVAYTLLLVLGTDLVFLPLTDEITADVNALSDTDPNSPAYAELIKDITQDTRELIIAGVPGILYSAVVGSGVWIVSLFAAVSTYSGEAHTLGTLLRKAMSQLKGPALTLAFVYLLQAAYVAVLSTMTAGAIALHLVVKKPLLFFPAWLLVVAGFVFLVYFSVLCSLSVAVSVAEPGCSGAGAVGRAWLLAREKKRRAVLYYSVTGGLGAVLSPVHTLARTWARGSSVVPGLLLGLVYVILMGAVQLFAYCAITAFYFECKESLDLQCPTGYAKISTEEDANA